MTSENDHASHRARIRVPELATKGEIIEIRTLVSHPMETGYRRHERGERVPRNIIERFVCTYNGEIVFRADLHPAVAANPYLSFHTRATESGRLELRWEDDRGEVILAEAEIEVR